MKQLFVAFISFISISLQAQNFTAPSNWKTLKSKEYVIQYPEDLSIYKQKGLEADFMLLFPVDKSKSPFQENVSLITQKKLANSVTLADFKSESMADLKNMIPALNIDEEAQVEINGITYEKIVYTGTYNNSEIVMMQYYAVYKNTAYVLSYTTVPALFTGSKPIVENIFSTFIITKKK